MIADMINTLTSFVATYPQWIGFAVFAATALESMAFIGSFLPGMSIVLALSGIAASLGANIWILVLWCTMGAILGDGVSYWLGHKYGDHLKSMWPFRTHPQYLEKGTDFFQQNGGKSILIGRFLPFTRAVVPVAAGMLGMNPVHFYIANILSAIGWAFMNVLPAAGLGLTFAAINQASSRVAIVLAMFVSIFIVALIIGHIIVRFILPHLEKMILKLSERSRRSPKGMTWVMALFFGANSRPATISAIWVVLTLSLVLSFAKILEDVVTNDPLVRMDVALNALVQGFRTPLNDQIMTVLTSMGDFTVVLAACISLIVGLLLSRAWRTAGMALLVLVTTAAFVPLLKTMLHKPRPFHLYSGAESFAFPSGHAAFSALLFGLIAVVGTRGLSQKTQATIWASALTISISVGLSRIYLSAHWPSDVMGGLLFGWIMASLFGLFESRNREPISQPGILGLGTLMVLIAVWVYHATVSFDVNLAKYQATKQVASISLSDWRQGGWKQVPPARIDLKGEYEEPLSFQTLVSSADIEKALRSDGWVRKPLMKWRQSLQFFGGERELSSLPPLPLLHNGTPPVLTMVMTPYTDGRRDVLRLWPTDIKIRDFPGQPMILVGSLTQERITYPVTGINILRDRPTPPNRVQKISALLRTKQTFCILSTSLSNDATAPWLILPRGNVSCQEPK